MNISSRALPSSLHQKIKIPVGDDVLIVSGDSEKVILSKNTPVLGIGSSDIQLGGFSCKPRVQALTTQSINYMPPDTVPHLNERVIHGVLPGPRIGRD